MVEDRESDDESLSRAATSLVSRNLVVFGRKTTVRLEREMWASFKDIAECEGCTVHELASRVYSRKKSGHSFTSAIRVFLLLYYRDAAAEADHANSERKRTK